MITLITGENSFENDRHLRAITRAFDGVAEVVDGDSLELRALPDLLMGVTLFATKRLVVIKGLSENKSVWNDFTDWIDRVSDDVHLLLIESAPDKRTKTYKQLQKVAKVQQSTLWTDRDTSRAEQWVIDEAKRLGTTLDKKSAHVLVERVGVDQWSLIRALEKLSVMDAVTPELIESLVDANPTENVFLLFENALKGNAAKVKTMVDTLALTEDAYKLLGLLSGQAVQLATLTLADKPSAEVAKDMGVHPYALSKLAPVAKKLGRGGAKKVIGALREADEAAKTSATDPWLLIERALMKVATI